MTSGSDKELVDQILNVSGVRKRPKIYQGNVPNALATVQGDELVIIYNRQWLEDLVRRTGSTWSVASVIAHELGHHSNWHFVKSGGSNPEVEKQADYYSGFALARLGATLDEATAAMEEFGSD